MADTAAITEEAGTEAVSSSKEPRLQARKPQKGPRWKQGAFWKKQARIWHWISGALCLIGTMLFAITGITLNHAAQMEGKLEQVELTHTLTPEFIDKLNLGAPDDERGMLPADVAAHLNDELGVKVAGRMGEWSDIDVYVGMPRPGGDSWLSVDRETGEVIFEASDRGAIAYLNDLHKGRHTGTAWSWFIDIFAGACVLFCLTGLWLLQVHSAKRPITWPLTIAGLAVPVILAMFFIHG